MYQLSAILAANDGRITIVPRRQDPEVGLLVNVGPDEPPRRVCVEMLSALCCGLNEDRFSNKGGVLNVSRNHHSLVFFAPLKRKI